MAARTPVSVARTQGPRPHSRSAILVVVVSLSLLLIIGNNLFHQYQRAAMFRAAEKGDLVEVKALLAQGVAPDIKRDINHGQPSNDSESPLLAAARANRWQVVHLLLEAGATPNIHNDHESVLGYAIAHADAAMVHELLLHHADVRHTNMDAATILAAFHSGDTEKVHALLEAGADANAREFGGGELVLSEAVSQNRRDMVQLLLAHGADVNAHNGAGLGSWYYEGGYTPLMMAVLSDNTEMVRLLLARGASPRVKWTPYDPTVIHPMTPLQTALQHKRRDIAALLQKAGAKE